MTPISKRRIPKPASSAPPNYSFLGVLYPHSHASSLAQPSPLPCRNSQDKFLKQPHPANQPAQSAISSGPREPKSHDISNVELYIIGTTASLLVMQGVDLTTVRDILRHKSIEMTLRYAHLAPAHRKAAVDALEHALKAKEADQAKEPKTA